MVQTDTDGSGRTTTYAYDPLGRLASVSDPLGRRHSYDYDGAGRLVASIDASGQTTSYAHDAGGELTGITYSGGTTATVTYAYDADGRRTQMLDGTGTSSYTSDSLGRLVAVTTGAGSHVGYGYGLAANLLTLDYPATASVVASLNGTTTGGAPIVTRTYDRAGRMASVSDWLGHTTSFSYDADSNLVGIAYPTPPRRPPASTPPTR